MVLFNTILAILCRIFNPPLPLTFAVSCYEYILAPYKDTVGGRLNISRYHYCTDRHAVAQLVEALRYKPEGLVSTPTKNEYREYFLGGKKRPVRRADNLTTFM
jgi:hypothetical protein